MFLVFFWSQTGQWTKQNANFYSLGNLVLKINKLNNPNTEQKKSPLIISITGCQMLWAKLLKELK